MIFIPDTPYNTEPVYLYLSIHTYGLLLDTILSPTATYIPLKYDTLFRLVPSIETVPFTKPVVVHSIPVVLTKIGVAELVEVITYVPS